ncbi:MAG: hypothetical protein MUF18_21125 [Fimbriiglobus sp.]|nr:hypothetical protein [Fimbriiglobus sp.]
MSLGYHSACEGENAGPVASEPLKTTTPLHTAAGTLFLRSTLGEGLEMKLRGMLFAALVAAVVGCANARHIHKDANGGVIAMPADTAANRKKAEKLMLEHVGPGYQVVEEKEVVTGQVTTNHSDTQNELGVHSAIPILPANKQITTTTTSTKDVTEWHIIYRRGGTPSQATAPLPSEPIRQTGGKR